MTTTVTTEIPAGYTEARYKMNPETEDLLRTEDLEEGMIVLVESMFSHDDPKEAEDPDCSPYVIERLEKYQTWRRVTKLQESRNDIVSWVGVDANGNKKGVSYGHGLLLRQEGLDAHEGLHQREGT